jgi:TBP-interacting protein
MATIKEVPTKTGRFERIGAHTHVKGLGLDEEMKAIKVKDGMGGQEKVFAHFLRRRPEIVR